jgi:hypothetical protein
MYAAQVVGERLVAALGVEIAELGIDVSQMTIPSL